MVQMLQFVSGHLPRQQGCYFRVFVHPADAPAILHLPGTFTWTRGLFHFWVFPTLHHPDAPAFLRTFTWTWGLFFFGFSAHYIIQMLQLFLGHLPGHGGCFFSGFLHTTSSSCSGFAWDIYLDRGCFFRGFRTVHHPVAPVLLGTFTWTGVVFFGFSTHSSSCSGFAWDIYPDTGVGFFGFPTH